MNLAGMKELNAYHLANMADCGTPNSLGLSNGAHASAGAAFLTSVRDAVVEAVEWELEHEGAESVIEAAGSVRDGAAATQIADDAPDIYTHQMWAEFIDLAAYNEDPDELGGESTNVSDLARLALYTIAERLVWALLAELEDEDEDEDEMVGAVQ